MRRCFTGSDMRSLRSIASARATACWNARLSPSPVMASTEPDASRPERRARGRPIRVCVKRKPRPAPPSWLPSLAAAAQPPGNRRSTSSKRHWSPFPAPERSLASLDAPSWLLRFRFRPVEFERRFTARVIGLYTHLMTPQAFSSPWIKCSNILSRE